MHVSAWHVFWQLVLTDLRTFRQIAKDKVIDLAIWVSTVIAVTSYLMPYFGMSLEFGRLTLVGTCASAGLFEVFPSVMNLIADFENECITGYYLTLPLPAWLVFFRLICFYALSAAALGILVLPLGNLILPNPIPLLSINWLEFAAMFVLMNLFYGAFTLFIASYVKNMARVGSVWMRLVYPLWFLGGFQFSWASLRQLSPALAYVDLCNPMTFIMDGLRTALMRQSDGLPFLACLAALAFFTLLCSFIGIRRLCRRLDCA
jgi:ABC-2 type transport system permease protein